MTNDQPHAVHSGDLGKSGTVTYQPERHRRTPRDGTKKTTPVERPAPAGKAVPSSAEENTLVLRPNKPPVDQLDYDNRHDTRATESEAMLRRAA